MKRPWIRILDPDPSSNGEIDGKKPGFVLLLIMLTITFDNEVNWDLGPLNAHVLHFKSRVECKVGKKVEIEP